MTHPHVIFAEDDLNFEQLIQIFFVCNELKVTLMRDGKDVLKTTLWAEN